MSAPHRIRPALKTNARGLRREATFPERLLWSRLRDRGLDAKFRRQQPIGRYVADFYSAELKLVIEIDGDSHDGRETADQRRTKHLERLGLRIIRFTNDQIIHDVDAVTTTIFKQVTAPKSSPTNPSPSQGEVARRSPESSRGGGRVRVRPARNQGPF